MHGQRGSNPQPAVLETATLPIELCPCIKVKPAFTGLTFVMHCLTGKLLFDNLSYLTCTNGTTTFANSETETFFHSD